jgi:hypothetical protein
VWLSLVYKVGKEYTLTFCLELRQTGHCFFSHVFVEEVNVFRGLLVLWFTAVPVTGLIFEVKRFYLSTVAQLVSSRTFFS